MSVSKDVPSTSSSSPLAAVEAKPVTTPLNPVQSDTLPAWKRRPWNAETWSTVVTAVCTLITLIVAVLLGLHSMRTSERSLETMSENVRQSNLLGIYSLNLESSKFFDAHPQLVKFFDKLYRPEMTDKQLQEEFDKLEDSQKALVRLGCDKLADFMQVAFLQRDKLPDADWNNWWSSMCDEYDESLVLREYLMKRRKAYAFINAIKPETRDKYYRGEKPK